MVSSGPVVRGVSFMPSAVDEILMSPGSAHPHLAVQAGKLGEIYLMDRDNRLIGTGRFPEPPIETADYKVGYLCGMIRGDGHVGKQFRLALVDIEALHRTRRYLTDIAVPTTEFLFAVAVGHRKEMTALRAGSKKAASNVSAISSG